MITSVHATMQPTSALELWKQRAPKLSTGCHRIDAHLNGGLTNNGIIEVAGEAGSGKTQFCMQLCFQVRGLRSCISRLDGLCLQVQLPERLGGLNGEIFPFLRETHRNPNNSTGAAVYITSEDVPIKRLKQMSSAYQQVFLLLHFPNITLPFLRSGSLLFGKLQHNLWTKFI